MAHSSQRAFGSQHYRVLIDDLNPDGRGRGTVQHGAHPLQALVSGALPGEEVELRVDRTTRNTLQGRVGRLLVPHPERERSACAHRLVCTGCPLLEAPLELELAFKRQRVVQAVGDAGLVEPVRRVRSASWGYRHYAKQVFAVGEQGVHLGSYVAGTHQVQDNRGCPVLATPLIEVLDRVALEVQARGLTVHEQATEGLRYAAARCSAAEGTVLLTLVTSGDPAALRVLARDLIAAQPALVGVTAVVNRSEGNALLTGEVVPLAGELTIEEEVLGHRHRIGPTDFFQINPAAAAEIFRIAVELAGSGERCLEGYAGVGALTLPLSERFARVWAVEVHGPAMDKLRARASEGGITAITGDVAAAFEQLLPEVGPDVVVLDPPRKGLGDDVVSVLARRAPSRLVLVACGPEGLARDVTQLRSAGFEVRRVVPVDQFPHTAHVESVVLLERTLAW